MNLADKIRDVPDFPKEGIIFKDITTLLKDPGALKATIDKLEEYARSVNVDVVAGIESRGFIFGTPLADRLGCGFIPVRKPGKLPAPTESEEYSLEYGTDKLEIHKDAISEGMNVLIVDDLLATGGTARAVCNLVRKLKGNVSGCAFVIELDFLNGRQQLEGVDICSLVHY